MQFGSVKIEGTALFFRPGLLLCAHNPKVGFALVVIQKVELLRTNQELLADFTGQCFDSKALCICLDLFLCRFSFWQSKRFSDVRNDRLFYKGRITAPRRDLGICNPLQAKQKARSGRRMQLPVSILRRLYQLPGVGGLPGAGTRLPYRSSKCGMLAT